MVEEDRPSLAEAFGSDAVAAALVMGADGKLDPRAAAFLAKQSELVDLQIADLKREDKLRHWSLRVRHISDVLKVAFELSFAFIALLVAVGLGAAIWTAANDTELVIDPFSVPPDFVARGLTGEVLAADINDKVGALAAGVQQFMVTGSFRADPGNDIKVQIPDTGISVGQLYAYLVRWLGHEKHINGSVYRVQQGLVLTLRVEGAPPQTFEGREQDFSKIEQDAVEKLMSIAQPFQYAFVELQRGQLVGSIETVRPFVDSGTAHQKADAYVFWATALQFRGDLKAVLEKERLATDADPDHATGLYMLYGTEADLGSDEASLHDAVRARDTRVQSDVLLTGVQKVQQEEWIANVQGDYLDAARFAAAGEEIAHSSATDFFPSTAAVDLARAHDLRASREWLQKSPGTNDVALATSVIDAYATVPQMPVVEQDIAVEAWGLAFGHMQATYGVVKKPGSILAGYLRTFFDPWFAFTLLKVGRNDEAHDLIDTTPVDCYFCLRVRAQVAASAGNFHGAESWFSRAVSAAPSIPFAYKEWGEMLLHRGDYAEAIAKFEKAHEKGPRYADALELWGEALMQQNRSDFALVKFSEANRYAPNWGRLHLEWGKALAYAGHKNEAKAQYEIAKGLEMSVADRASLARAMAHG
jgi:Flp pilus assembly protein TadD